MTAAGVLRRRASLVDLSHRILQGLTMRPRDGQKTSDRGVAQGMV